MFSILLQHIQATAGWLVAVDAPGSVSTATGNTFASNIRTFIGPIVLLGIGLGALKFLFQRQMTQFFQFMAIAVLVGVFFYTPNVVENLATWLGSLFGGTKVS